MPIKHEAQYANETFTSSGIHLNGTRCDMTKCGFLQSLVTLLTVPLFAGGANTPAPVEAAPPVKAVDPASCEYVLMHISGDAPCGKPALLMSAVPAPGAMLLSSQFSHLDGSCVLPGIRQRCDSCGRYFEPVREAIWQRLA